MLLLVSGFSPKTKIIITRVKNCIHERAPSSRTLDLPYETKKKPKAATTWKCMKKIFFSSVREQSRLVGRVTCCVYEVNLSAVSEEKRPAGKMGLNRLISLSKGSVMPEIKSTTVKGSKIAVKTTDNRKEKCRGSESGADMSSAKIDNKTLKNGKSATTTKKSMLWNTLRMTNKNKNCVKKGKLDNPLDTRAVSGESGWRIFRDSCKDSRAGPSKVSPINR